jgi:hypothetical protein
MAPSSENNLATVPDDVSTGKDVFSTAQVRPPGSRAAGQPLAMQPGSRL